MSAPSRIRLAEQFLTFAVMRELFPLCHYCGTSLAHEPLGKLVKVQDRNRLAHQQCPQAEAAD
jgi:hypothetical protein